MITHSCCCGSCQSRTYLVSGPWCMGCEHCSLWQFRMRDGEGRFVTDKHWMVSGAYCRGCHSTTYTTLVSFFLSTSQIIALLLSFMLLPAKRVSKGSQREWTEMEKSTGTRIYPLQHIYYGHNYVKKSRSSAQGSTKQAFKWEMTLVSTEAPETAQPILMRMKRFFDHYLRGKKTFSPF